jgi:hypothetical protein
VSASLQNTRETLLAYAQANREHADTTRFFSHTVVSTILNTGEKAYGRAAVLKQISALQSRASAIRPKNALFGEGHAVVEVDFVTPDDTITPYSVIYEFRAGEITSIRFYFAGNVPN